MEDDRTSLDILGIKPIGRAIDTTVTKTFQGIEGFLKSVCAPALDEVGLMLRDQIRYWRLNNILRILEKAKGKLNFEGEQLKIHAHPRVALAIIENGSLNDNDEVQELWAGLFASSCTPSGQDDENLIFVNLLKQLTIPEARILKHGCEKSTKIIFPNGLVIGDKIEINSTELIELTGIKDIYRLDRELDHLHSLEIIGSFLGGGGFNRGNELIADISPTALALNLYIRSLGSTKSPAEYWKDSLITLEQKEKQEKEKTEMEKRKQDALAKQQKEEPSGEGQ
ncbi:MAG: hypothetical protein ABR936_10840 [Bacteroidota bacterium]|jgi:hypothetical protein